MQRILLSDRCLYHGGKGISRYLYSLLRHWPADAPFEPVGLMTHRLRRRRCWPAPDARREGRYDLRPLQKLHFRAAVGRRAISGLGSRVALGLYEMALTREARRGGYLCYFEPNNLAISTKLPTVTMMHDLSVLEHPQWHHPQRVRRWGRGIDACLHATKHWIVPSQFTRGRMIELLAVPADRICVIAEAPCQLPLPCDDDLAPGRRRSNLPQNYLLHLGTIEPRKGLDYLLDSYALVPSALRQQYPLVLAGSFGWGDAGFIQSLVGHPMASEVLTVADPSDSMVASLLGGTACVVVPSRYEGFGLPVLEAMAAGSAVICSDAEALVEVAGSAACVVEVGDVEGWSKAMVNLIEDMDYRRDLQRRGLQRVEMFSWDRAASAHIELFRRVLES